MRLAIVQVDATALEKQTAERKQQEEEEKLRKSIFGKLEPASLVSLNKHLW